MVSKLNIFLNISRRLYVLSVTNRIAHHQVAYDVFAFQNKSFIEY